MKKENQLFKADFSKENYKIEITVCENGSIFKVEKINKDFTITYESMIGALEISKMSLMKKQSDVNRETYKKQKTKK